ncbi:helix-turn-helix domain-containing protein [Actinoplanes sp. NPDC024001]|uniref:TetR/AcrR family transcriptional regulator n=1 Tax=Actinoplanes sp. NPDC024001 TaxID=3154598 RepID=UPI0033DD9D91
MSRAVSRTEATRVRLLVTAERLFAEHGVAAVSSRQISEAAGQGNNAAVGYHFGTKDGLVRALVRGHAEPMERSRRVLLDRFAGSADLRDRVTCLVQPFTDHLAELGNPSWYARFAAQVMTEPALRQLAAAELADAPMLRAVTDRLHDCVPHLTPQAQSERDEMAHTLIVQFCAQRERTAEPDWSATAVSLIDAIEGLYRAPHSGCFGQ